MDYVGNPATTQIVKEWIQQGKEKIFTTFQLLKLIQILQRCKNTRQHTQ